MKKILVFGGNGFIGSETCKSIIEAGGFHLWVVNRGRSWDWDTKSTVKPFVDTIKFNRDNSLESCEELVTLSRTESFDAIIDFSGYDSCSVQGVVDLFRHKVKLYIYISSDSVYEVCEKKHSGPSIETDSQRPKSKEKRKVLKRRDSYGHKKLKCEEVLAEQVTNGGIPYVIFRLADVIGQKDSTERWWQYQLWIQTALSLDLPLYVPYAIKEKKISLVYVKDIAQIILKVLTMNGVDHILNQEFNLACKETTSVPELLNTIADNLSSTKLRIHFSKDDNVPHIFPSVERGPINCDKVIQNLGFEPTPLSKCIQDITNFYVEVAKSNKYEDEKKDILESLEEDLKDLYDGDTFKRVITKAHFLLSVDQE